MITFPSKKHEILAPWVKGRNKCLYGGRGGAKSWSAALAAIAIADQCKCRIFCTREVQVSIEESMYKLIKDLIRASGREKSFKIYENEGIIGLRHGSEFIFKGMHNCKSIEGIDIAIVEEAQQVSKKKADLLIPTVRKPGSQIWWLWNPENETDWVHQNFINTTLPDTVIQKVLYTDNPHCSEEILKHANYLKNANYEEYKHIYLGELRPEGEGWGFINPLWIDYAASGNIKPLEGRVAGRGAIGCDPAFAGTDKCIIVNGKGNRIISIDIEDYSNSVPLAKKLNDMVLRHGRFNCDLGVDSIGVGQGVCDILSNSKVYGLGDCLNRLNSKDYSFVPPAPRGTPNVPSIKDFDCWRSQAWYLLATDLEMGNLDLSGMSPEHLAEFKKQVKFISKTRDKRDKIRITPKEMLRKSESLGYSPDLADAIVAYNWVRKRDDADIPRQKVAHGSDFSGKPKTGAGLGWVL